MRHRPNLNLPLHGASKRLLAELGRLFVPPMPARRFTPPRSAEDIDACFVVKEGGGQKLAYVYYGDEPSRRFEDAGVVASVLAGQL